jgi:protein-disulfide isomerase
MRTAKDTPIFEKREVAAPTSANPSKGATNASVVIQVFSDFQCGYCQRINPTIDQVLDTFRGQVRVVFRNMPLPFHKDARLAGEAAQEVFEQQGADGFWKYHATLFANQKALERQDLAQYARAQGVDMDRFKRALDKRVHRKHIDADIEVANQAQVRGTPSVTNNGYFMSGAQPFPQFERVINYARKNP